MTIFWLVIAVFAGMAGVLIDRKLRRRLATLSTRRAACLERLEVYQNYGKLATLRHAEWSATLTKLRHQIREEEQQLAQIQAQTAQVRQQGHNKVITVFDRIARRTGRLWLIGVEGREGAPWDGEKHYAIVGENGEDTRQRVKERHPAISGFHVRKAVELDLSS